MQYPLINVNAISAFTCKFINDASLHALASLNQYPIVKTICKGSSVKRLVILLFYKSPYIKVSALK